LTKKINNNQLLIIITLLILLVTEISQKYLNHEELLYNFYSEQLAQEQIEQLLKSQQKWSWLSYTIIPLLIFFRSSLVALCLSIGTFFYNT
jgi:hypothetical protein